MSVAAHCAMRHDGQLSSLGGVARTHSFCCIADANQAYVDHLQHKVSCCESPRRSARERGHFPIARLTPGSCASTRAHLCNLVCACTTQQMRSLITFLILRLTLTIACTSPFAPAALLPPRTGRPWRGWSRVSPPNSVDRLESAGGSSKRPTTYLGLHMYVVV